MRLYNLQPHQAQAALDQVALLQPNLLLLRELKAAAATLQFNPQPAWQLFQPPKPV